MLVLEVNSQINNSQWHEDTKVLKMRKYSLMFVIYSLIFFVCCLIFFAFAPTFAFELKPNTKARSILLTYRKACSASKHGRKCSFSRLCCVLSVWTGLYRSSGFVIWECGETIWSTRTKKPHQNSLFSLYFYLYPLSRLAIYCVRDVHIPGIDENKLQSW